MGNEDLIAEIKNDLVRPSTLIGFLMQKSTDRNAVPLSSFQEAREDLQSATKKLNKLAGWPDDPSAEFKKKKSERDN